MNKNDNGFSETKEDSLRIVVSPATHIPLVVHVCVPGNNRHLAAVCYRPMNHSFQYTTATELFLYRSDTAQVLSVAAAPLGTEDGGYVVFWSSSFGLGARYVDQDGHLPTAPVKIAGIDMRVAEGHRQQIVAEPLQNGHIVLLYYREHDRRWVLQLITVRGQIITVVGHSEEITTYGQPQEHECHVRDVPVLATFGSHGFVTFATSCDQGIVVVPFFVAERGSNASAILVVEEKKKSVVVPNTTHCSVTGALSLDTKYGGLAYTDHRMKGNYLSLLDLETWHVADMPLLLSNFSAPHPTFLTRGGNAGNSTLDTVLVYDNEGAVMFFEAIVERSPAENITRGPPVPTLVPSSVAKPASIQGHPGAPRFTRFAHVDHNTYMSGVSVSPSSFGRSRFIYTRVNTRDELVAPLPQPSEQPPHRYCCDATADMIMVGISSFIAVVGIFLYCYDYRKRRKGGEEEDVQQADSLQQQPLQQLLVPNDTPKHSLPG